MLTQRTVDLEVIERKVYLPNVILGHLRQCEEKLVDEGDLLDTLWWLTMDIQGDVKALVHAKEENPAPRWNGNGSSPTIGA